MTYPNSYSNPTHCTKNSCSPYVTPVLSSYPPSNDWSQKIWTYRPVIIISFTCVYAIIQLQNTREKEYDRIIIITHNDLVKRLLGKSINSIFSLRSSGFFDLNKLYTHVAKYLSSLARPFSKSGVWYFLTALQKYTLLRTMSFDLLSVHLSTYLSLFFPLHLFVSLKQLSMFEVLSVKWSLFIPSILWIKSPPNTIITIIFFSLIHYRFNAFKDIFVQH